MATGRSNKLVGQVGEFLVCAELGRQNLIATPFSGNVPGFDVIATDERFRSLPIQVKTISSGDWPTNAPKHLRMEFEVKTGVQRVVGLHPLADPKTVMIFVSLRRPGQDKDRFFILTRRDFQRVVHTHYTAFLARHSGRRPKKPESFAVRIRVRELERFEDAWELIGKSLGRMR